MFASLVRPELKSQLHQHIIQAFQFIQEQQNKDGSFKEPGKVIHKDMQVCWCDEIDLFNKICVFREELITDWH